MPTVFMMLKPCFVCGTQGHCPDIGAPASYHGPRDLDTRPSASQRSSIYMWVQRCLKCGYCALDISHGDAAAGEAVRQAAYKKQLDHPDYSETANSFLCRAMILERVDDFVEAGWACVYAAWVCDDSGFAQSAVACRRRAVAYFRKAQSEQMPFAADSGEEARLLIDLLRRCRDFDAAAALATAQLREGHDDAVAAVLQYELDLVEDKDAAAHTMAEALED